MYLKPTKAANGSIFDINEEIAMEVMLYPKDDETPCPWDADILVENGKVTVSGGMGPGGYGGARCVCTFSVDRFPMFYKLELRDELAGDPSVMAAIEEAGWVEDK